MLAILLSGFDGGRTRARTLDPLIKSKRFHRDTTRQLAERTRQIPCNSRQIALYPLTRGDKTRHDGSAGRVRSGSADPCGLAKGGDDEAHATQDREPRMPGREEGHPRFRRRASRPRRPRDGRRRKVLPRPISPCRREATRSSRLMLGHIPRERAERRAGDHGRRGQGPRPSQRAQGGAQQAKARRA